MEDSDDCPICGEGLAGRVSGRVNCNSRHVFCYDCIHRWGTESENSCPLCKQVRVRGVCVRALSKQVHRARCARVRPGASEAHWHNHPSHIGASFLTSQAHVFESQCP